MTAGAAQWLVIGAQGMLGADLIAVLAERGIAAVGVGHGELDITDAAAVDSFPMRADVVVNCAGYTAVDAAETDEERAHLVNAVGAGNLARGASAAGARFVHISTDYVFAGDGVTPYPESHPVAPVGAYGRTKAAGEALVSELAPDALIVRTAWLYGEHGRCFPKTIHRLASERGEVAVVGDQVGQPTWTRDLAELLVRLVTAGAPGGIYHGTASGQASWFDFAREIVRATGSAASVSETTSAAFPLPARRPAYSVLGHGALEALSVEPIGHWAERWSVAAPAVLGTARVGG